MTTPTNLLQPSPAERRSRARADLRLGLPVVLRGASESVFAVAVETASAARFHALSDDATLAITGRRAETLKARAYDGDVARLVLPADASLSWARAVADPATDLDTPMKGPFQTRRGGDATLAREAIMLAKEAQVLPAVLLAPCAAGVANLTVLDLRTDHAPADGAGFVHVVDAALPLALAGAGRLHVFRPDDGGEEHYAVEIGTPDRAAPVLARLHSACFTGDVLGSLKCDCGPQLHGALRAMHAEGGGILLYLNQEGRGIGLANKMRAYALQDQGYDTVEANHRLGFEDDERDFRIGAALLRRLGVRVVRLMTNNPAKIAMMEVNGIGVAERVPLHAGETPQNAAYLATKVAKSGHLR
ncbi:MAG: GTP cyclohydrolase II [Pseudomonadota bacterium]